MHLAQDPLVSSLFRKQWCRITLRLVYNSDSWPILQLHHLSCHPHVWSFPSFVFSAVISHPHGSLERGKQAGWTLACKARPLPDVYSPRQFNQSVPAGPIRGAASVCRIRYILKWICYSLITPLGLFLPHIYRAIWKYKLVLHHWHHCCAFSFRVVESNVATCLRRRDTKDDRSIVLWWLCYPIGSRRKVAVTNACSKHGERMHCQAL